MSGTDLPAQRDVDSASDDEARRAAADTEMAAVVDLLVRGLRALGGAGQVDLASRLAGKAWWVLRTDHERAADRINGLLHYLARLPESPSNPTPSTKEEL